MSSRNAIHAVAELFESIHSLTRQLHAVLESEARALSSRRHNELETLSEEKQALAAQLEKATIKQQTLLKSFSYPAGGEGVASLLAHFQAEGSTVAELSNRWEEIRALTEICQSLNQRNGAAIKLLGRHFKRALEILYHQLSPAYTYGPDGSAKPDITSLSRISV